LKGNNEMKIKNLLKIFIAIFILPLGRMIQLPMASNLKRCVSVAAIVGFLLVPGQRSRAATLYVDWCATGGEPPYHTLTSAVAAANPGDSIIMEAGIYPETLSITKTLNIFSQNGAAIIGTDKYNVGWRDVEVPRPCENAKANARIYYPSWVSGPNTQIAHYCGGTTFPVVVYAHGLSSDGREDYICEDWANPGPFSEDYKQAGGILSRLAASGIIAVSFSWAGASAIDISRIIIDTIGYLKDKNQEQGSWLQGKVDLTRVGFSGHSNGGGGAIDAVLRYNGGDYCEAHMPLNIQIKGLGLIAPGWPWLGVIPVPAPVLMIHGTREHCRQVGLSPLEIYCESNAPKHLVYVIGANHFGYTDGICLNPEFPASNPDCIPDHYDIDATQYLPTSVGRDNDSQVGGLTEQAAHALQQRAAGNYLEAFFSYYLHDHLPDLSDIPGYLVQTDGTQPQCGHPGEQTDCKIDFTDPAFGGPPAVPPVDCMPKMLFDDLVSSNVEVNVCHAITCP
jgi:hypothetical protein